MAKILVVDDDIGFVESIKDLLESFIESASVFVARSGQEGLRSAATNSPDVILLDLAMPGMDGFEVSRRLKSDEATRSIPVVMLTGLGTDSATKVKALELGADAFLSKPCEPGELAAQIGVMLRIKEAEDRLRLENVRLNKLNEQLEYEVQQRKSAEEELGRHREKLEILVQKRTAELFLLQEINNSVNTGAPLEDILRMTIDGVRGLFGYAVCIIYFYNKDSNQLAIADVSVDSMALRKVEQLAGFKARGHKINIDHDSSFYDVVHNRKVGITTEMEKVFSDFTQSPVLKKLAGQVAEIFGFKAVMSAPLVAMDEVIGVIGVARKSGVHGDEALSLGRFAAQLAIVIHKSQTESALRREYAFKRAVEDSVTSGIIAVDLDGTLIYANPAFGRLVGFEKDELYEIKPPFPFWLPEEANRLVRLMTEALKGSVTLSSMEQRFIRKDGKLVETVLTSSPLRDEAGEVIGLLVSVHDITERKRLEKQVLVASEEERQSIGRDLHDGVGQYLTGTAFMAKALEDKLRKRSMPDADEVSRVVGNLNEAIDKVRRLASGFRPVQISSDRCCVLFREIAAYAEDVLGLRCRFRCDEEISLSDKAALGQMYMICREALVNAAKHSGTDSVTIRLSGKGDSVSMTVEDNGDGGVDMSSEDSPAGMGLSIMRYRAGMIGATLEINRGTTGGTVVECIYNKGGNTDA